MPFDVLPRHDIKLPQVQFYHPSPEYARLALEASKMRYDAISKGLDTILNAADPYQIAQRRFAIASMPIKMKELEYQTEMLKVKSDWMQEHRGEPFPGSYGELMQREKLRTLQGDNERAYRLTHPDSADSAPDRTVPPVDTPKMLPTRGVLNDPKFAAGDDLTAPVVQPGSQYTTPPSEENVQKFGKLPGFENEDTDTSSTGGGGGASYNPDADSDE